MAENPKVASKFDRSGGKGIKAPHISTPGGAAHPSGSALTARGDGHVMPRQGDIQHGGAKTTHYPPGNTSNVKSVSSKTPLMTDSIKQMKR